jgi:hypothetical protein
MHLDEAIQKMSAVIRGVSSGVEIKTVKISD